LNSIPVPRYTEHAVAAGFDDELVETLFPGFLGNNVFYATVTSKTTRNAWRYNSDMAALKDWSPYLGEVHRRLYKSSPHIRGQIQLWARLDGVEARGDNMLTLDALILLEVLGNEDRDFPPMVGLYSIE
jgi:hypothetical protein